METSAKRRGSRYASADGATVEDKQENKLDAAVEWSIGENPWT